MFTLTYLVEAEEVHSLDVESSLNAVEKQHPCEDSGEQMRTGVKVGDSDQKSMAPK